MKTRKEKDALGIVEVPKDAYYGSFTVRAQENFEISGIKAPEIFKKALGMVKKAAAQTNMELEVLDKKIGKAIVKACDEFIAGDFDDQYTLDVFQAGAGTPLNMNANEIIANRANELLGYAKGKYELVHPNNHVNMAQSTNDTIPTASRIATLFSLVELCSEIGKFEECLRKQSKKTKDVIKVGRTHLEDAVPISMSQEFDSYADSVNKDSVQIQEISVHLQELGIGGTALGSGINTHPKYQKTMCEHLTDMTGIELYPTKNMFETTSNYNVFGNVSAALKSLALTLMRIANDLKLMNMGPKAGLAEIILPEVEPGSSIMPGKVNPSVPECVEMVACQVIGNDTTIMMGIRGGQMELNVNGPFIMYNLIQSVQMLTNVMSCFRRLCIDGIIVNKKHIKEVFENSLCTATALNPYLGYQVTAEIVNEALEKGQTVKETILKYELIDAKTLDSLLSIEKTTKPQVPDKKIIKKIENSEAYKNYRKRIGK